MWWAGRREEVFGLQCWAGPKCSEGPDEVEGRSILSPRCKCITSLTCTHDAGDCLLLGIFSQMGFNELVKLLYKLEAWNINE